MQWEDKVYTPERVAALWDDLIAAKATFVARPIPGSNLRELLDYCDLAECQKLYKGRKLHPEKFMYTYDLNRCDICDKGYPAHNCITSQMSLETPDTFLLKLYTQSLVYAKSIDFFKYLVDTNFVPSNWLMEQILIMTLLPEHTPKSHHIHYMSEPALKDLALEYLSRTYLYLYYDTLSTDLAAELLRRRIKLHMCGGDYIVYQEDIYCSVFIFNTMHRVTTDTIDNYMRMQYPMLQHFTRILSSRINIRYLFTKILNISDAECRNKLYKYYFERYDHMYRSEILKHESPELYALIAHIAEEHINPTILNAEIF